MNADRVRAFTLSLPHVVETLQWGENLVFWVGDKAIGGKMFALLALGSGTGSRSQPVISFSAGPERFTELLEIEGMMPAPYLARVHWIAAERWSVVSPAAWQEHLRAAHAITFAKLTSRLRGTLLLPPSQLQKVVVQRRQVLRERIVAKGRSS